MRDETGERCSLDEVLREVLEHLMDSRGENRVKLTKEMVPTRLCDDIAKAHTKKLVYKFRFEHIDNWGRLMGHYTAENLRDLAASKCIPRGMTPPYQAIQRHLNEADAKHLSVSRIFRTLGIGMQFDIKMMVRGFICSFLLKYPRETLMEMAKEGKPRFLLLMGNDGFRSPKMDGAVGCYMFLSLLPAYGKRRLIDFHRGNQIAARNSNLNSTLTACLYTNGEHRENMQRNLCNTFAEEEPLERAFARVGQMKRDELFHWCSTTLPSGQTIILAAITRNNGHNFINTMQLVHNTLH